MKTINLKTLLVLALIISGISFSGCEQIDEVDPASSQAAKLKILLTDAPFPTDLVEEANVLINKVEIRKKDHENDGYPFITLTEEEMPFNLLELTNGVTAELVDIELEPGTYDHIRLHVADAGIKLKDGTEYDLKIPSGAQTGIKIFIEPAVQVVGGLTAELILDFNVSKSFVVQGNPNTPAGIKGFIFKPVIKATNKATSGSLEGFVTDTDDEAIEGAEVTILAADTVYTSSFTSDAGSYEVIGLDAGTYDVVFAKEDFVNDTIMDIEIIAGNITRLDVALVPVDDDDEGDDSEGDEGDDTEGDDGDDSEGDDGDDSEGDDGDDSEGDDGDDSEGDDGDDSEGDDGDDSEGDDGDDSEGDDGDDSEGDDTEGDEGGDAEGDDGEDSESDDDDDTEGDDTEEDKDEDDDTEDDSTEGDDEEGADGK